MPRANRYFLPDHVWHITHRCHKKEFLLKFARDRRRWRHWQFEAKKRFGLCVLSYIVASDHVHMWSHIHRNGTRVATERFKTYRGATASSTCRH